jgi:hypothetical protein
MEQRSTATKEHSIEATIYHFCAVAVAAILVVAGLGRAGIIDVKQPTTSIPGGVVPHGGAEKPVSEQMSGGAR